MLAARMVAGLGRGAFLGAAGFTLLLGGGVTFIAATVGVCTVAGFILYGVAHLFAYLFGISFRWGLAIASWLLFVGVFVGALIHDLRMIRGLAASELPVTNEP